MKEGRIGKRATVSAAKSTKRKEVPRGESSGEEVSGKFAPQEKPKKKSTAPVACKSEEVEVESVRKESSLKEKTQEGGQRLALPSMPGLKPLVSVNQFRVPSAETLDNQLATPSNLISSWLDLTHSTRPEARTKLSIVSAAAISPNEQIGLH